MSANSPTTVLDTSALLALIEDEESASRVEEVIRTSTVIILAVALMELFYILRQKRSEAEAYHLYAQAREVADEVVWKLDEATILRAGRFKADHPVSLADAWIAATAEQRSAVLLLKDPEFEALRGEVRIQALPWKKANSTRSPELGATDP